MKRTLYDTIGIGYARLRRPDPRIGVRIVAALDGCRTIANVGAGSCSYEPAGREVIAIEPSAEMLKQRARPGGALRAVAEALPLRDGSVDGAMTVLSLHHWSDWRAGLREMRRVAARRVAVFTWDPGHDGFWLTRDWFPEIRAADERIFPSVDAIVAELGGAVVEPVPVPHDCSDGFLGAYWRRPERYLDAGARRAISAFRDVAPDAPQLAGLERDVRSGAWHRRHADLLDREELDVGYRLISATIASSAGSRRAT